MEPGTAAWKKIKEEFGDEVFLPSGQLNRERLGEIIFENVDKRRKLNEYTHPEIHRTIMFEVLKHFMTGNITPKICTTLELSFLLLLLLFFYLPNIIDLLTFSINLAFFMLFI